MNITELAWAAGIFEGEGCFYFREHIRKGNRFHAQMAMTDPDVVERFQRVVGFGHIRVDQSGGRKPLYRWSVQSHQHMQALVAMFWSWLGERRRQKATTMLRFAAQFHRNGLRKRPPAPRRPRGLPRAPGERNGHHKLTAGEVRVIRATYGTGCTQKTLGERYGVGQTTISRIVRGENWSHA